MEQSNNQALSAVARHLRSRAWSIAQEWQERTGASSASGTPGLDRFGEFPAFVAAISRALATCSESGASTATPQLVAAATRHARLRAASGMAPRDMLAEFTSLRGILSEAVLATPDASTVVRARALRAVDQLLDMVIVEVADRFVATLTDQLVHRAERDQLTGLLNRRAFHERLSGELARAQRHGREVTVVAIDLDAFKDVNDTLGHLAGDALLARIAELLRAHTREQDIVGRLGGDEFAVALVEAGLPAARDLIRRLRIHLAPARRQLRLPTQFGISFGAASFPQDGATVNELLFAADSGMYAMKGDGRGSAMQLAGHSPEVRGLNVLVVDDDAGVRELCRQALAAAGFEVAVAADGPQALEIAGMHRPDVMVIDIMMPGMDGWQLVDELARESSEDPVPIVMMTGRERGDDLTRADAAGAVDFIAKPFDPERLVTTVHDVLELVVDDRAPHVNATG